MISSARFPLDELPVLAKMRADSSLRIHVIASICWAQWPVERADILECMRPIRGVEFFEFRPPYWYRHGELLPSTIFPPSGRGDLLIHHLSPESFQPSHIDDHQLAPVRLQLVPGSQPHHATALKCSLEDLSQWIETATISEIRSLRAARSGEHCILLGKRLPVIVHTERFWGENLLLPLGYRLDPELPDAMIRLALRVAAGELLFFTHDGSFIVPSSAFVSFTRSGVRMVTAQ